MLFFLTLIVLSAIVSSTQTTEKLDFAYPPKPVVTITHYFKDKDKTIIHALLKEKEGSYTETVEAQSCIQVTHSGERVTEYHSVTKNCLNKNERILGEEPARAMLAALEGVRTKQQ